MRLFQSSRTQAARRIAVPEEMLDDGNEPGDLLVAVADTTGAMLESGFRRWELPVEAMQAYHADCYHARVTEEGHRSFIDHVRGDPVVLSDIAHALVGMDAGRFRDIFASMIDWIASHQSSAARSEDLDALVRLDRRFAEADGGDAYLRAADRWLSGLDMIEPIADADLPAHLAKLQDQAPDAAVRRDDATVARIDQMLTAPFLVGLHMAVRRSEPSRVVEAIGAGRYEERDGEAAIVWDILTDLGDCRAIEQNGVTLISGDDATRVRVPEHEVTRAIAHAESLPVADAAHALFVATGRAGPDWIAWARPYEGSGIGDNGAVYHLGSAGGPALYLVIGVEGAALVDPDGGETLAKISRRDLFRRAEARKRRADADREKVAELRSKLGGGGDD